MLPGSGSFHSANVRIRTRRRGSGTTGLRLHWRVALRGVRRARSIVAALIASTLARIGSSKRKWPWRSKVAAG